MPYYASYHDEDEQRQRLARVAITDHRTPTFVQIEWLEGPRLGTRSVVRRDSLTYDSPVPGPTTRAGRPTFSTTAVSPRSMLDGES